MQTLYTRQTISVTEFKQNPVAAVHRAGGMPMAVLSHNQPAFYVVPPAVMDLIAQALASQTGDAEDLANLLELGSATHEPAPTPGPQPG